MRNKIILSIFILSITKLFGQTSTNENQYLEKFNNYVQNVYLELDSAGIDYQVFYLAMKGYFTMKYNQEIENTKILTIVDFSRPLYQERLFVFDLDKRKLLYNTLVAHAKKTGVDYPRAFSNRLGSNKSCYGFFVANEPYRGSNGFSLRLDGKERGINHRARDRGVVMHGSVELEDEFIEKNGFVGRSLGCISVPQKLNREIINTIEGESCLFIYYPNSHYVKFSDYLNNDVYLEHFKEFLVDNDLM